MSHSDGATHRYIPRALLVLALLVFYSIVFFATHRKTIAPTTTPAAQELPTTGRWFPAPAPLSDEAREKIEAVGYAPGYEIAPGASGVNRYDKELAAPGVNLVLSGHAAEALLMDAAGTPLHTWARPFADVWRSPVIPSDRSLTFGETLAARSQTDPKLLARVPKHFAGSANHGHSYFRRARLFPNGDLLTIYEFLGMVKLDRDSKVLWSLEIMAHHDFDAAVDGRIYALAFEPRESAAQGENGVVLDDYVAVLSPDGKIERKISILDAFLKSPFASIVTSTPPLLDQLHTNAVKILDGRLAARLPAFAAGNLLISCRNISALAVLDPGSGRIVWAATGSWKRQHEPTVLDSGRLLLLDNQGNGGFSRVIELDPSTLEITWEYAGTPPESFATFELGTVARLPNGNTLVTESYRGHAFELTPDKRIVWDYLNPKRTGADNKLIAALYEVVRLPEASVSSWLPKRATLAR